MRTVVLGPRPPELEAMIARRRALGLDLFDEVWEGEYHMAPAPRKLHAIVDQLIAVLLDPFCRRAGLAMSGPFNLGGPDNFRVPDRGVHRDTRNTAWSPTAAAVIEVESPDDETWEKLDFYAARGVDEVLIVTPSTRSVTLLRLGGGTYMQADRSELLDIDVAAIASQIDWPDVSTES